MRIAMTLMIGGMLLTAAGCSYQGATTSAGTTAPDLNQTAKQALAAEPQLDGLDVSVNPDQTRITLSGTVPSERLRTEAVEMAQNAGPNVTVIDQIEVKPPEVARNDYTPDMAEKTRENAKVVGDRIGQSLDDAWLYSKIEAKLLSDSDTPARKINVDVVNKVVILRGEVTSEAVKDQAERMAKDTA